MLTRTFGIKLLLQRVHLRHHLTNLGHLLFKIVLVHSFFMGIPVGKGVEICQTPFHPAFVRPVLNMNVDLVALKLGLFCKPFATLLADKRLLVVQHVLVDHVHPKLCLALHAHTAKAAFDLDTVHSVHMIQPEVRSLKLQVAHLALDRLVVAEQVPFVSGDILQHFATLLTSLWFRNAVVYIPLWHFLDLGQLHQIFEIFGQRVFSHWMMVVF